MDRTQARDYLELGLHRIEQKRPKWDRREAYYRGQQDLPYAPEGVNAEYLSLREMALANWLALAMDTPIQRLRADGFRTGRDGEADDSAWNDIWQPNKLDSRQRIVYTQMVVHGRGLMSVWPAPGNKKTPVIRPENGRRVHLEADPSDPWTTAWVVKSFTIEAKAPSKIVLPEGVSAGQSKQVGMVYDATSWARFERDRGTGLSAQAWRYVDGGTHDMGEVPYVAFDNRQDADGLPQSGIETLMPAQDAINTIRFQTLLAMQFSAYRQRLVTGFDPVVKDPETGLPVIRKDDAGNDLLDAHGRPVPLVSTPGRVGVDRLLAFPGTETKVFDLPESNLDNYIKVLAEFLTDLFAVGQVPPQYLLNRMSNLSSDALSAAESTLQSLVTDLQRWTGESLEQVMRLGHRARGGSEEDVAAEVIWADAEAKSFAQLVDGITKLVTSGFPKQAAFEMLPGATPQKVSRWMRLIDEEQEAAAQRDPATALKAAADGLRATDAPISQSAPPPDDDVSLPTNTPTAPGLPVSRRNGVAAAAR